MRSLLALCLTALAASCASPTQQLDPQVYYKRTLSVCIDGQCAPGVGVFPAAVAGTRKNFTVTSDATMALYTFNSCHREVASNPNSKTVSGYFTPVAGLEDRPACKVQFAAFDSAGQHAWGSADFQDPLTVLPHTVLCNGETIVSQGVSQCQSRKDLIQQVKFTVPVVVATVVDPQAVPVPICPKLAASDRMNFEFAIGRGECTYRFEEIAGKRQARLTTTGYESIRLGE